MSYFFHLTRVYGEEKIFSIKMEAIKICKEVLKNKQKKTVSIRKKKFKFVQSDLVYVISMAKRRKYDALCIYYKIILPLQYNLTLNNSSFLCVILHGLCLWCGNVYAYIAHSSFLCYFYTICPSSLCKRKPAQVNVKNPSVSLSISISQLTQKIKRQSNNKTQDTTQDCKSFFFSYPGIVRC